MGIYRAQVRDVLWLPIRASLPEEESRALRWTGQRIPSPAIVNVVLDTGSARSSLRPLILTQLQCTPGKRGQVQTTTGRGEVTYYEVRMEFLAGTLTPLPRVVVVGLGMPQSLAAYGGVIGRDILGRWETIYSGPLRRLAIRDHASFWGWLYS